MPQHHDDLGWQIPKLPARKDEHAETPLEKFQRTHRMSILHECGTEEEDSEDRPEWWGAVYTDPRTSDIAAIGNIPYHPDIRQRLTFVTGLLQLSRGVLSTIVQQVHAEDALPYPFGAAVFELERRMSALQAANHGIIMALMGLPLPAVGPAPETQEGL